MIPLIRPGNRNQTESINCFGSCLMISLVMCLFVLFASTGTVHASAPDQITEFPQYLRDNYSATCSSPTIDKPNATFSGSGANAGQVTWLSLEGQPTVTNFVVQSGSTLNLQLNIGSLNCSIPQNTTASTFWHISGGNVPSLTGREVVATYPSTRRFNRTEVVFRYTAPAGITSPTLVTLLVDAVPVNDRPSGSPRFQCIKPPSVNAGSYNNWRACYLPVGTHWRTVSQDVMVVANDSSPGGNSESTCDYLSGAANDPDWGGNISVDIYRDGNFETRVPTSGGRWSYGVSQYKDFAGHTFEAFAQGVDRSGNPNGVNPSIGKIFVGPCAKISCQSITTSGLVEAGSTFRLGTGIGQNIGTSASAINVVARLTITGAAISPGSITQSILPGSSPRFEWDVTIDNSGYYAGDISFNIGGNVTNCNFGGFNPNCVAGSPGCNPICPPSDPVCCPPNTCTPCIDMSDRCPLAIPVKPYFRVFGGNVTAGVTDTSCEIGAIDPVNSPGRILAFSKGSGNGSGSQLIVQALGIIEGFSSAQGPAGSSDPDKGLSLSNTAGNSTYGGAFGPADCPDIPTQGVTASSFSNAGGPTTLSSGTKQVIYATGDVTISNNVLYGGGPWANVNQIPAFTLVVTGGNIYIDNDVTELHGFFIAKPSGNNGGNIYTCTNGGARYTAAELSTGTAQNNLPCSKPLTVYGSFMAKQVKLLRTNGKTSDASNGHTWSTPLQAEKFIFTPELWVRSNGAGTTSQNGSLDSLKPLPPVL